MAYKKLRDDGCCSVNFLKYILLIFNFIFLLAGLAVLGVGIWTVVMKHTYVSLLTSSTYPAAAYILIVAGAIVLVVSVIGCCGVKKEDRSTLLLYTFLLLTIFLLEALAGVLAYVYERQVHTELTTNLKNTFLTNYGVDDDKTTAIDSMQQAYKCCGAMIFYDWQESVWLKEIGRETNNTVPDSCCKSTSEVCGIRDNPSNIYYSGCIHEFEAHIKEHLVVLGAVGIGICLVQIFGMIFSCCLYIKLRNFDDNY